ncbi:hypothetical protein FACS1894208_08130 [Clostridia bacterium]|nr:hypothetical protein FACS1894208_08130 [Clostridia bacterium]
MKIQSVSVVVPGNNGSSACINDCGPCVSRMHCERDSSYYPDRLSLYPEIYDRTIKDYVRRLDFCRDNGANSLMITGQVEPQQNMSFLKDLSFILQRVQTPFRNVEMQTTGVGLDVEKLRFLRDAVGVNTLAVSLFSLDDEEDRWARRGAVRNIAKLCKMAVGEDFNLRLCMNMTKELTQTYTPEALFAACAELGANQVTLRKLWSADDDSPQTHWVKEFGATDADMLPHVTYLRDCAVLRTLEYGWTVRRVGAMSVVYDSDSMAKDGAKDDFKYLVVRPNGKLYSSWDDPASLIF